MKSRVSSLNPYAASFVPLAKQKPHYRVETSKKSYSDETKSLPQSSKATKKDYQIQGASGKEPLGSEDWTQEGHKSYDSDFDIPNGMTEKQYLDEAAEMDLAYLMTLFPGLSEQSLEYVYATNGEDVDAAADMLKLLEHPAESSQSESSQPLPDTLNIGDVPPESKSPADAASLKLASLKLKEPISSEASGSSCSGGPP